MQNLQDLQDKILFETKNILSSLSQIDSKEELLAKQDLFVEVTDRIAFLRILDLNKDAFLSEENSTVTNDLEVNNQNNFDEINLNEELIEEEVQFTNEINNISEEEFEVELLAVESENNSAEVQNVEMKVFENVENPIFVEEQKIEEVNIPLLVEQDESDYHERVLQKEKEFLESEERRRTIVEFNKQDLPQSIVTEPFEEEIFDNHLADRKFKLANIKGLKAVQDIFDEDPLANFKEEQSHIDEKSVDAGSILKTNISTEFMEAEKKKPEFKIDFNDKIAFTKLLFNGNETELKDTIAHLNSYENIEDARQYLSDIYYQKDWSKADEYAQRLWNLVENKFM